MHMTNNLKGIAFGLILEFFKKFDDLGMEFGSSGTENGELSGVFNVRSALLDTPMQT